MFPSAIALSITVIFTSASEIASTAFKASLRDFIFLFFIAVCTFSITFSILLVLSAI